MFEKQQIKQQVRLYIQHHPENIGTTFSFEMLNGKVANRDLCWIEKDKEFTLNGEMYDVISMSTENNKLTVHAINDKAEKKLKHAYQKHQKGKHQSSLSQFATVLFVTEQPHLNFETPEIYLKKDYYYTHVGFTQLHLPVIVPPPDMI